MPSIQLVQPRELNANFQVAQQPGTSGVRVNNRELIGAWDEVKQAVATGPRYKAEPNGLQDLGQGIEHLGEVGIQLAKQNQMLTDVRKATDVRNAIEVSNVELKKKIDESNDPSKIEQITVDHTSETLAKMDTEGMSEVQKQHLEQFAKHWQDMAVVNARYASVVKNQDMAVKSLEANEQLAVMNRDPASAVESVNQLVRLHVITHEQGSERIMKNSLAIGDANVKDLQTNIKTLLVNGDAHGARALAEENETLKHPLFKAQRDNTLAILDKGERDLSLSNSLAENPQSFVYALQQKDENGDPKFHKDIKNEYERQDWIAKGMAQIQQNSTEGTFQATNMMAEGQMTAEKLNTPEWKQKLTPQRHAMLMDTLKKGKPNNPSEWMATATSIDLFQGVDQNSTKLALDDMTAVVNARFQGPYRDSLLAKIKDKANGSDSSAEGPAKKIVAQAFADGELGNYKVPYSVGKPGGANPIRNVANAALNAANVPQSWFRFSDYTWPEASTSISPADQARAAAPDKIGDGWSKQRNPAKLDVGETVVDIRRRDEAAFKMMEINIRLDEMKKSGSTPQAMMEYAKQSIQGVRVAPATKQVAPVINSNEAAGSLFPAGSYEDAVKALEKHATH